MPSRKRENFKRKRRESNLSPVKEHIYIYCEGTKTEPFYFEGFRQAIGKNVLAKNAVHITIVGVGTDTTDIVNTAKADAERNGITDAQIWCVYDKDDFKNSSFDAAETLLNKCNKNREKIRYCSAWSNECIEYWFILHFDCYRANNHRTGYIKYLDSKFKSLGLKKYKKNSEDIFDTLVTHGNPKQAIVWAKEILDSHGKRSPSQSAPATKVYLLVEELAKYLPNDLLIRFI